MRVIAKERRGIFHPYDNRIDLYRGGDEATLGEILTQLRSTPIRCYLGTITKEREIYPGDWWSARVFDGEVLHLCGNSNSPLPVIHSTMSSLLRWYTILHRNRIRKARLGLEKIKTGKVLQRILRPFNFLELAY